MFLWFNFDKISISLSTCDIDDWELLLKELFSLLLSIILTAINLPLSTSKASYTFPNEPCPIKFPIL